MQGLEAARKAYSDAMDALGHLSPIHAAAVTHAVLALIVAEREDEARLHLHHRQDPIVEPVPF